MAGQCQVFSGGGLLLLRGYRSVWTVSTYSRFNDEQKERYFGVALSASPSMNDFTISDGRPPRSALTNTAEIPFKDRPELGLLGGALNANLPAQRALFNVISDTLPASNVTRLTRKQTYCG